MHDVDDPHDYGAEEFHEKVEATSLLLEKAADDLGIYLQTVAITPNPDFGKTREVVLVADFVVGDRAWKLRTQDPAAHEANEQAREMFSAGDVDDTLNDALREQWKGLLGD